MTELSGTPKIQALQQLLPTQKLDKAQFEAWKQEALIDQKIDKDEARFLMDQLAAGNVEQDVIPAVTELLSGGFQSHTGNPVARIGGHELKLHKVAKDFNLDAAKSITENNGIDEVYFKDEENNLYVAFGDQKDRGALDLDRIKLHYITRVEGKKFTVAHINNETNTTWEGAKAPWVSSYKTLKDAGQSGIVKGIGEMATAVTAMFIGKTVWENGVKSVSAKAAEEAAKKAAEEAVKQGAGAVATAAATEGVGLVTKAKTLGSTIGESIKGSLRSVVVGGAVAGVVVGTVVGVGSAIGAVSTRFKDRDYTSLDMVTGHY